MNEKRKMAVQGSVRSRLRRLLFANCQEVRFLISKSLDTKLSWKESLRVYTHLATCSSCRHYQQQLQVVRRLIRCYCAAHPESAASWRLSEEARERIKKTIRDKTQKPESEQLDIAEYSFCFRVAQRSAQQPHAIIAMWIQPFSCIPVISPI